MCESAFTLLLTSSWLLPNPLLLHIMEQILIVPYVSLTTLKVRQQTSPKMSLTNYRCCENLKLCNLCIVWLKTCLSIRVGLRYFCVQCEIKIYMLYLCVVLNWKCAEELHKKHFWHDVLRVATCGRIECRLPSMYRWSRVQRMIFIAGMSTSNWASLLVFCCGSDVLRFVVRILAMIVLICKCNEIVCLFL